MLVGSVVFGIAGVVEAGALTATIALFVGLFIYRTITWTNCKGAFVRAFRNSAMVFVIIAAAGPFSWLLTSLGAINQLEEWLLSYTYNPLLFALVLVLFICLLGMVMDSAANIIVVGPVLVDVMVKAGYLDVQAALVVVVGFPDRVRHPTGWRGVLYGGRNCKSTAGKSGGGHAALPCCSFCPAFLAHRCTGYHDVPPACFRVCEVMRLLFPKPSTATKRRPP